MTPEQMERLEIGDLVYRHSIAEAGTWVVVARNPYVAILVSKMTSPAGWGRIHRNDRLLAALQLEQNRSRLLAGDSAAIGALLALADKIQAERE